MESFDVSFVRSDGKSASLRLFSHYTCICGKFSGEGKSEFVALLKDDISTGDVSVVSRLPFAIATAASLEVLLDIPGRSVIIFLLKLGYPLQGVYKLNRDKDWFVIENVLGTGCTK